LDLVLLITEAEQRLRQHAHDAQEAYTDRYLDDDERDADS
jgi:hypothetical protein